MDETRIGKEFSHQMKSVVITSTNKLEDTFIDRFLTQDNQVVVVGDVKTDAASYENIRYHFMASVIILISFE